MTPTEWAIDKFNNPYKWVLLDTETTGLGSDAEIIDIAVVSAEGKGVEVLLNQLIKPSRPIPADASAVNGIFEHHVADAPTMADIYAMLVQATKGKTIITYNAAYDARLLRQTCELYGLPQLPNVFECAMEKYAEWYGEWNDYHGNYRWQPLRGGNHRALGDCYAALEYMKRMTEQEG